jgi:NADP-dependent 3-hydroxy acid dehydrogenase YdfG
MALPWRLVWITGASSGIGAAIARELAAAGVTVAVSGRNPDTLGSVAAGHSALHPYVLDVTNAADVAEVFERIERERGPVDLVLAAAGTYAPVSLARFTSAPFRQMYETNYLGVVHVLSAVLPAFRARRSGHVAWIASVAGYRGLPKAAAYGPTKAALINLAESLRPELEADGVRVSVINPGFVRTPLTAQNDFPMPFLMEPEEAARRSITGLATGRFEIAFPSRFVMLLKFARLLPYRLYFALIRRAVLKR